MRVLVQRVSRACVSVDGDLLAEIGRGMVLLVGVGREDAESDVAFVAQKCVHLRIFEDDGGKMNRSLLDVDGEILAISQFTLYADTRKGRRPSFTDAAPPEQAAPLFDVFVECLRKNDVSVRTGAFGAHMLVEIHNDGPVTLTIESP